MNWPILLPLGVALELACARDGPLAPRESTRWRYLGLGAETVYVLAEKDGDLYAGTSSGLYRTTPGGADTTWTALGLHEKRIEAVLPVNAQRLLAAVQITGTHDDTVSLYLTTDGGASWRPYQNGFGQGGASGRVRDLAMLGDGAIFASGGSAVIAKSLDSGATWLTSWGGWWQGAVHTFVHTDPLWPNLLWAGGEDAFFQPFLLRSEDRGVTWQEIRLNVGGDNAHYTVAIDPTDSLRVYTGMEGRIMRTTDGGRRWDTVFAPSTYPYVFGLEVSRSNPKRIFAGGSRNTLDPQPLVLYVSDDGGESWGVKSAGETRHGGVLDLLLLRRGPQEIVVMATQRGVFSYEPGEG